MLDDNTIHYLFYSNYMVNRKFVVFNFFKQEAVLILDVTVHLFSLY